MEVGDHKTVTNAWNQWKALNPNPDAGQVYEHARKMQSEFGHLFMFSPDANIKGIWEY